MNLKFIVSAIVALPLLSSSLFAKGSTKLFSPDVFHDDGSIDVVKATGAHILHRDGLRGEGRCIAIIDDEFSPDLMDRYIRRGVIHPDAIRDGLFITPREKNFLNYQKIQNKRKRYMDELDRKAAANESFHGVDVLDVAHSMAPRATILPIDKELMPGLTSTERFCNSVRQAMRSNPDVINISFGLSYPEPEPIFRVMDEATRRGIAFTIAAGNDSLKDNPVFLDYGCTGVDPMPEVFRRLRGDGMVFAGSLKHKRSGNAVFAKFSQHPLPESGLIYRYNLLPGTRFFSEHASGTSYSSPALAGGYVLLKQHSIRENLPDRDKNTLLNSLNLSGFDVTHEVRGVYYDSYKGVDLPEAQKYISALSQNRLAPTPYVGPIAPAPYDWVAAPAPIVQPAVPAPIVQPAAPAPIVQPAAPAPIVQPAPPAPIVQPAAPAPIVQPAAPAPIVQPAAPAPIVQPAAPAPIVQPAAPPAVAPAAVVRKASPVKSKRGNPKRRRASARRGKPRISRARIKRRSSSKARVGRKSGRARPRGRRR